MTPAVIRAALSGDLDNFLVAVTPGGIESQEKRGQIEQSFSETLPLRLQEPESVYEKLGFVFGQEDGLFVECKFPEGWKKKPTDHAMWTEIVDEQGRKRGMIFYKAAFYDQRAHAFLVRRFDVEDDYAEKDRTVGVTDICGKVDKKLTGFDSANMNKQTDSSRNELTEWLNTNYPDWKSPLAYWTE